MKRPRAALRASFATVLVAASVVLLAGCNGLPAPAPSATALPEGIRAYLVVTDHNELSMAVTNTTDESLDVSRVRLRSPALGSILVGSTVTEVPAHQTRQVRIPVTHVDCEAASAIDPTATVQFTWGAASGVAAITLSGAEGALQSLVSAQCPATAAG
jgi:hypothetical protein